MKLHVHPLAPHGTPERLPDATPDRALIDRLRASFATFREGDLLVESFYRRLFAAAPQLRAIFPAEMAGQRAKLLATLAWVVEHLDRHGVLMNAVAELGRRHVGYGAEPGHFPLVIDCLLGAIAEAAGPRWGVTIEREWRQALELLSDAMIDAMQSGPRR